MGRVRRSLSSDNRAHRLAFGDAVRARRKALGLSQEALAEGASCTRQSVNRIENGAYSPSLDRLWALATALDVPLSRLVADAEQRIREQA